MTSVAAVSLTGSAAAAHARANRPLLPGRPVGVVHRTPPGRRETLSFPAVVCMAHRDVAALVQTTVHISMLAVACTTLKPGHPAIAGSSYSLVMGASERRRVRWWWLATAFVALVVVVLLAGDRSGSCADYVNSPGVCTSVNEDPRTWVLVGIGVLVIIGALYQAFRRR